jgi:hypothetical protein
LSTTHKTHEAAVPLRTRAVGSTAQRQHPKVCRTRHFKPAGVGGRARGLGGSPMGSYDAWNLRTWRW